MIPLPEATTLPAETRALLLECKRVIQQFLPDATVMLYGSVARGTAGPDSDYDLAVLTNRRLATADQDHIRDAVYDLELEREVVISVLFFDREQWETPLHQAMPLHREVEREGVVL